ncbi:transcription repressor OFP8-like [Phragmites australis]|uniref:transcription repressor OFP8-like n=1 Tax=Phragmites australis TaxID=29695 RepID=UPI002D7831F3|nr:transcription repressor OFP8-like [Phragmites australis]
MKATTRRGAAGGLPSKKKKKKAARGFMCGCGGSKSVSTISRAAANISSVTTTPTETATTASAAKPVSAAKKTVVSCYRGVDADDAGASAEGTPGVDALLRQLRELERGVRALGVREREDDVGAEGNAPRRPRHRRSASDWEVGGGVGRLESESVAVVTESADPLRDFRWSMVQMIEENGITGGAELRGLLQRFLALNSARHHHLILRAFADVWEELFAGGGRAPPPPAPEISYSSRASKQSR